MLLLAYEIDGGDPVHSPPQRLHARVGDAIRDITYLASSRRSPRICLFWYWTHAASRWRVVSTKSGIWGARLVVSCGSFAKS
jgi:hypothetical protein